jgi:squalene cyclase
VDVATLPGSDLREKTYQPKGDFRPKTGWELAIEKSQNYLLSEQKPEGYWVGELIVDGTIVADSIAYHHWNGKVDLQWQRKAVNHLLSLQLPDGGWNTYYGGPAEVNATIKAYLALKLAGVPATDPRMLRAREVAKALGGVPRMNTFSKLYLALLGLFPWEYVPTIPCEVILIGKWFYVNINEMSSWSRSMLVPLAIINHFKPTRPLDRDQLAPPTGSGDQLCVLGEPGHPFCSCLGEEGVERVAGCGARLRSRATCNPESRCKWETTSRSTWRYRWAESHKRC